MSEEEKKKVEELKSLLYTNTLTQYGKRKLIYLYENLIEKQQKEIENITQYAEWHILHLTEDIKDYIDDDKKGNADIIGELKEEREHWKDIIRITKNEKTYIDYKD